MKERLGIYDESKDLSQLTYSEVGMVVICGNVKYAYIVDISFLIIPYIVDEPKESIHKVVNHSEEYKLCYCLFIYLIYPISQNRFLTYRNKKNYL